MATNQKPRITYKRRYKFSESYTILVDGEMLTRSTDGDESWLTFNTNGDTRPFACDCFIYLNDFLVCIQLPATPQTVADTLKALRPLIQQAVINARLQAKEQAVQAAKDRIEKASPLIVEHEMSKLDGQNNKDE